MLQDSELVLQTQAQKILNGMTACKGAKPQEPSGPGEMAQLGRSLAHEYGAVSSVRKELGTGVWGCELRPRNHCKHLVWRYIYNCGAGEADAGESVEPDSRNQ